MITTLSIADRDHSSVPVFAAAVTRSVRSITRSEWNACFPGDPEGWAYYCAIEESGLADFSFAYFAVREYGRVVAVAPAFVTDYRLDTLLHGRWKDALKPLLDRVGRLLSMRMLCLGSPVSERCHIGFAPDLTDASRRRALACLLASVEEFAAANSAGLLAVKDATDADLGHGAELTFADAGYARRPGLPNTLVALPAGGEPAYLQSLSATARREVRRKLRVADGVRIEIRRGTEALGLVPEMVRLYEAQRHRSHDDFDQFEKLTPGYFRSVLTELGQAAVVFLYWHREQLLAFNFCYHSDRLFVDKFIGFEPPLSRAFNLYVLSWMTNVRYCLERGIPLLQPGQTAYAMKRRLGASLHSNWILFRHRNPFLNAILRLASPLLVAQHQDAGA
ncbi:MAG: GNAT family N-acetyltransferase [Acidobacteriota bacterium]